MPFTSRHQLVNLLAAVAAAQAVGVEPSGAVDVSFGAMRGEHIALPSGVVVINDCYNANPLSMRAALDDLATQAPDGGRRVAVLGDMLELGAGEVGGPPGDRGLRGVSPAVDVLVAVGPLSSVMPAAFGGEAHVAADAAEAASLVARLVRARRRRAGEGVARDRPGDGRGGAGAVGEVLIAGTASLLICIFLSPKFIAFLRAREFGQNIREDGPEGHHAKAGTPTMGGIIIFTAIAVPFLLLTDYFDWRSSGVFGVAVACALLGFADDYTKLVKRRSLGLRGRTKLFITVLISIGLWLAATEGAGLPDTVNLRIVDASIDLGYLYPIFIYLVVAGTTSAVNLTDGLDGLAAGCAAIVLLAYIAITFTTGQLGLVAGRRVPGRRVRRVPVVQLVPGVDLHGGHRVAGAGRRDRRRWP